MRQATQMLAHWESAQKSIVNTVIDDTSIVALHVLTSAGLGLQYDFSSPNNKPMAGYTMTYAESLFTLMGNAVLVFVMPKFILSFPYLPKAIRNFKTAVTEFNGYMKEQVSIAKRRLESDEALAPNLLNAMVEKNAEEAKGSTSGLSDKEIYGNLFMFSFAGHETTANTISYAIYLLAAFPKTQEWVAKEVAYALSTYKTIEEADYAVIFPKLKRCMAVMVRSAVLFICYLAILTKRRKKHYGSILPS